jgi:hypothetical protein
VLMDRQVLQDFHRRLGELLAQGGPAPAGS